MPDVTPEPLLRPRIYLPSLVLIKALLIPGAERSLISLSYVQSLGLTPYAVFPITLYYPDGTVSVDKRVRLFIRLGNTPWDHFIEINPYVSDAVKSSDPLLLGEDFKRRIKARDIFRSPVSDVVAITYDKDGSDGALWCDLTKPPVSLFTSSADFTQNAS